MCFEWSCEANWPWSISCASLIWSRVMVMIIEHLVINYIWWPMVLTPCRSIDVQQPTVLIHLTRRRSPRRASVCGLIICKRSCFACFHLGVDRNDEWSFYSLLLYCLSLFIQVENSWKRCSMPNWTFYREFIVHALDCLQASAMNWKLAGTRNSSKNVRMCRNGTIYVSINHII